MSVDIHSEMRREYLYVQLTGVFVSIDEVKRLYLKIQEKADLHTAQKVLVDFLQLKGAPTTMDYYSFGAFIAEEEVKRRTRMVAYVGKEPIFDKRHFGELVATNRGARNMKAFDLIENALKWLRVEPTNEGKDSATRS